MQYNIDVLAKENHKYGEKFGSTSMVRNKYDQYQPPISKEQYTIPISIVFWDISGFSRLYRTFSFHDKDSYMLDFLNRYYQLARKIISKNNGTWDKAIGDGIMAWFGSFNDKLQSANDTKSDYGACDAIKAAIELRKCFEKLKRQFKIKCYAGGISIPEFSLKCGINTGVAQICLLYNQYTVMGTNVNLASRLEQFASVNQIVISESTKQKLKLTNYELKEILIDNDHPIKSFEDIRTCFEIVTV